MVAFLVLGGVSAAALALAPQSRATDPPPAVQADFKWTPAVPTAGDTVTFESLSRPTGAGNKIIDYRWDLDGDTSNSYETGWGSTARITHTYPVRGAVAVRLQVEDAFENKSVMKKYVVIAGLPPIVSYTFSPPAPKAGQPVLFTASATDPDGSVGDLSWDLDGDGVYENGKGPTAVRTFDAAGVYVVGLRGTDNEGATSFYTQSVSVSPAPLLAGTKLGGAQLRLMSPFPVVRIAGRINRRGARVLLLEISAPGGSKVVVRCEGRGCPFRSQSRAASLKGPLAGIAKRVRVRSLERLLRPGVTVRISVTRPGTIGKYTIFRVRSNRAPSRTDLCLMPGSPRPVACPSG
jgi:PKD domain-containing protein